MKIQSKIVLMILLVSIVIGSIILRYNNVDQNPDKEDSLEYISTAYLAGGCFWCTESDFEKLEGVTNAISGYMGGKLDNPAYQQVTKGNTGHREMVKIEYNPRKITYRRLVLELLRETDPTDSGGSFFDRGYQYTSAIYYQTESEKNIAKEVIQQIENLHVFDDPIATSIEPAITFWPAEDYHQNYAKTNPLPYKSYRKGSGRDSFIQSIWGGGDYDQIFEDASKHAWAEYQKPDEDTLRTLLSPLQFDITQREGTEQPFNNEYWDNHEDGIYVDIVSGEPLFSSTDKFDSGTGWPSFLRPLNYDFVTEKQDYKLLVPRTEIRSKYADSHLGHIILDGPISNNKIRYCMNSASLRFIRKEDLKKSGLEEYSPLFK